MRFFEINLHSKIKINLYIYINKVFNNCPLLNGSKVSLAPSVNEKI